MAPFGSKGRNAFTVGTNKSDWIRAGRSRPAWRKVSEAGALPICRGHPASNVEKNPRQVSWLSGHCKRPAFPNETSSGRSVALLSDYSCGGSSGLGVKRRTGFPFIPAARKSAGNRSAINIPQQDGVVSTTKHKILICALETNAQATALSSPRRRLAVATMACSACRVSAQPRVLSPQSGLTHSRSAPNASIARARRSSNSI